MKKTINNESDNKIDSNIILMRFLATVCMFIANFAYFFETLNFSFLVRFLASLAAPLFLFIFGYCSEMAFRNYHFDFKYLLKRVAQFALCAMFLDIVYWEIYPFQNGDILYTYIFSAIMLYVLLRHSIRVKFLTLLVFLLISLVVYKFVNYEFDINYLVLNGQYPDIPFLIKMALNNLFFTGWFPFLIWGVFPVAGLFVASTRSFVIHKTRLRWATLGFTLMCCIVLFDTFINLKFNQDRRKNNIELFYPLAWNCVLFFLALVYVVFDFLALIKIKHSLLKYFKIRHGLLIYVLHFFVLSILYQSLGKIVLRENLIVLLAIGAFICVHFLLVLFDFVSKRYTKNSHV